MVIASCHNLPRFFGGAAPFHISSPHKDHFGRTQRRTRNALKQDPGRHTFVSIYLRGSEKHNAAEEVKEQKEALRDALSQARNDAK